MKENEPLCPFYIGVFSALGILLGSKGVAHLVEQLFAGGEVGPCGCPMGFEQRIIMKIFLINHQVGRNRDIMTILFRINRPTRVFSGFYASYKRFAWTVCG